jgi:hypothetical protein
VERQFEIAERQWRIQFFIVPYQMHPCESTPNLRPGEIHAVVVVPKHGRTLIVWILIDSRDLRSNGTPICMNMTVEGGGKNQIGGVAVTLW